jgi:DnaK suppressor protein
VARPAKKPVPKAPAKPAPRRRTEGSAAPRRPTPSPRASADAPRRRGPRTAGPLSAAELREVRAELAAQQDLLRRELAELEAGTFTQSQSDLSGEVSFDEESADAGTFTFERERDLSLGNNIRDLLEKVEAALRRIDAGTYGTCERCGRPIDRARLKALPYSVLCVDCKRQEERAR